MTLSCFLFSGVLVGAMASGPGPFSSQWFANRNATKLFNGTELIWADLAHPDCIVTHLPSPLPLGADGDVARVVLAWESDGHDDCPASDWAHHGFCKNDEPCMHTSIHCLAGTGDFRIGLLDSNGAGFVSAAGWADTTSYKDVDKTFLCRANLSLSILVTVFVSILTSARKRSPDHTRVFTNGDLKPPAPAAARIIRCAL